MYKPKLQYIFCLMRERSLWSQLSLMKYLNSFGLIPCLMYDSRYAVELSKILKENEVQYKKFGVTEIKSEYFDIMFSESAGHTPFEKKSLMTSKEFGKINIKLNNAISLYQNVVNINYTPDKTIDTLHGMIMKGKRTIDHYKKFTKDLFFINAGDPDWDWFSTANFKQQVKNMKIKYGKKFLLIGTSFLNGETEIAWCNRIIPLAEKRGYKIILSVHVGGFLNAVPTCLQKYVDKETHRFILFAAASHVITNICSTMLADSMFLGSKVGCTASIPHFVGYGKPHAWIDDYDQWKSHALLKVGKDLFDIIPRVVSDEEINNFLTTESVIDQIKIDNIFGWKRKSNYCENLFKKVERKFT